MSRNGMVGRVAALASSFLVASLVFSVVTAWSPPARAHERHVAGENTDGAIAFRNDMRKTWGDHIIWTRLVIVQLFADLPETGATVTRFQRNTVDIGDLFKPYYGDKVGARLSALLLAHISIAAEILVAAKAGDGPTANEAIVRWYANSNDIAAFFNHINPRQWDLVEMQAMMKEHLDLTLKEALSNLAGDFATDIATFDEVEGAMLDMADMLSIGIINQFPHRFRSAD